MDIFASCLLGFGLLGGLLTVLAGVTEGFPAAVEPSSVVGVVLLEFLYLAAGSLVSLVLVSLVWHWPL